MFVRDMTVCEVVHGSRWKRTKTTKRELLDDLFLFTHHYHAKVKHDTVASPNETIEPEHKEVRSFPHSQFPHSQLPSFSNDRNHGSRSCALINRKHSASKFRD
jgi:hypothetical protein